jgi:hypothetical protein
VKAPSWLYAEIPEGGLIPPRMGVAYPLLDVRMVVCVLLPFNWLARWYRTGRAAAMHPGLSGPEEWTIRKISEARAEGYASGYERGHEKGVADTKRDAHAQVVDMILARMDAERAART